MSNWWIFIAFALAAMVAALIRFILRCRKRPVARLISCNVEADGRLMLVTQWSDEGMWRKIQSGEVTGYSLGGHWEKGES